MVKLSLHERFQIADENEKYLSELRNCLTNQKSNKKSIKHQEITPDEITEKKITQPENSDVYLPPVVRTAIAIRRWRGKQQET
jgi:hypothetical protein